MVPARSKILGFYVPKHYRDFASVLAVPLPGRNQHSYLWPTLQNQTARGR
jgi:hypothetical protein